MNESTPQYTYLRVSTAIRIDELTPQQYTSTSQHLNTHSLLHLECHSIPFSNLNLSGPLSTKETRRTRSSIEFGDWRNDTPNATGCTYVSAPLYLWVSTSVPMRQHLCTYASAPLYLCVSTSNYINESTTQPYPSTNQQLDNTHQRVNSTIHMKESAFQTISTS